MSADDRVVRELAKALGGLEMAAQTAAQTAERSERNRLSLLHLHAMSGVYIGLLFAAIGREGITGPIWVILRQIPGSPYCLGVALTLGGLLLAYGLLADNERFEVVGLGMMAVWYAVIAVSFGLSIPFWLLEPSPAKPAWYAHGVYFHLTAILWVHLSTLLRRRGRRSLL